MTDRKAFFAGGGIGSLSAAYYLIKDCGFRGQNIVIYDNLKTMGGSMDGAEIEVGAFVCRGGRMLNFPTYECLWELCKEVQSLDTPGKTIYGEIVQFNKENKTHANSRVMDKNGVRLDVETMGFTQEHRMQLLRFTSMNPKHFGNSRINEWFSDSFFQTKFWYMWQTTFAFQTWQSADELWRYLHRFMHEFVRIQTLEGVTRTKYDQFTSIIRPIVEDLRKKGVQFKNGVHCTAIDTQKQANGDIIVKGFTVKEGDNSETIIIKPTDLFFFQNGSMTDASSLGSWTEAPVFNQLDKAVSFNLWKSLADKHPGVFGNPDVFCNNTLETMWESFTVTTTNKELFNYFVNFQKNEPGTGALLSFKDSNWFMSIVIAKQPHFLNQKENQFIFWGYGLWPNKIGNYIAKRMMDCTGQEIFYELCQHCRVPPNLVKDVTCIPCMLPYIVSMFQPRAPGDRPPVVPPGCKNLGLISQFVEIPRDVVFTVEYSVRAGRMAAYQLTGQTKKRIPNVSRHDRGIGILLKALVKSYKGGAGVEIVRQQKPSLIRKALRMGVVGGIAALVGTKFIQKAE